MIMLYVLFTVISTHIKSVGTPSGHIPLSIQCSGCSETNGDGVYQGIICRVWRGPQYCLSDSVTPQARVLTVDSEPLIMIVLAGLKTEAVWTHDVPILMWLAKASSYAWRMRWLLSWLLFKLINASFKEVTPQFVWRRRMIEPIAIYVARSVNNKIHS